MPRAGMVGSKMIGTQVTALSDAKVGNTGIVESIDLPEEVSNYLAHLGFLPGTRVEVLRRAPAGDPTVYRIDGTVEHLSKEDFDHQRNSDQLALESSHSIFPFAGPHLRPPMQPPVMSFPSSNAPPPSPPTKGPDEFVLNSKRGAT